MHEVAVARRVQYVFDRAFILLKQELPSVFKRGPPLGSIAFVAGYRNPTD